MDGIQVNVESRQSIHYGLSFVFVPAPVLETDKALEFEGRLARAGVDLPAANRREESLELTRQTPPLTLSAKVIGPQIGQLLLLAEFPQRPLDLFTKETRAVIEAYKETWGVPKQFLSRDATIRCLYSCDNCKHAFQFLWEQLLGQTGGKTAYLGKPIWGGGLRFVMPPEEKEQPEPTQVEVKVESFLGDPEKLFVETQLSWPQPSQDDMFAKAEELLARVESYISQHVLTFLTQGD